MSLYFHWRFAQKSKHEHEISIVSSQCVYREIKLRKHQQPKDRTCEISSSVPVTTAALRDSQRNAVDDDEVQVHLLDNTHIKRWTYILCNNINLYTEEMKLRRWTVWKRDVFSKQPEATLFPLISSQSAVLHHSPARCAPINLAIKGGTMLVVLDHNRLQQKQAQLNTLLRVECTYTIYVLTSASVSLIPIKLWNGSQSSGPCLLAIYTSVVRQMCFWPVVITALLLKPVHQHGLFCQLYTEHLWKAAK